VTLRFSTRSHVFSMSLAVVSFLLLFALPNETQYSGWVYAPMGPIQGWNGFKAGAADAALPTNASTPPE
jgi:hypothetical protein